MRKITLVVFVLFLSFLASAQDKLNESEARWVAEANAEMAEALSSIEMSDATRLAAIKKAARTQRDYKQPSTWPAGKIALEKFMDDQFNKCKNEVIEMTDWKRGIEGKTLDQKLRLINDIQIEVVEEQVQMLIPGSTPVQLSMDAVNTVFGVNLVEGVNGGKRQDAQGLVKKFQELARSKELVKYMDDMIHNHMRSLKAIHKEREDLQKKVAMWKRAYFRERGEASVPTQTVETKPKPAKGNLNGAEKELLGSWRLVEDGRTVTGYAFNEDKTAVQTIEDRDYTGWRWEAQGGKLHMIGGNGKRNTWEYRISGNQLYLTVEYNGEKIEGVPLTKD